MEEMTARKKMSWKTPENVEEISLSSKTSSFYRQNVEEMTTQKKMSRKTPQNREKPSLWKENVPENATFPGHTIAQDGDYLLGNPS
jgi:hypothetical protein